MPHGDGPGGAYRELRDLSDGALDALAQSSDRAADVVRLIERPGQLESEFYDEEDLLDPPQRHCGGT